jgi:hypothetical protein
VAQTLAKSSPRGSRPYSPFAGFHRPASWRHTRNAEPRSQRHPRATGVPTVVSIIYAAGENVAWILREPETFLSSEDSKRMREIIGFLEENFAPMEWPISLLD